MQASTERALATNARSHSPLVSGLYVRVSTGRQEQEETIEAQLDQIRAAIEADGNILPQENIFSDDGWTGELLARPGLDQMREAAMLGKFEVLYVYDLGRLSRRYAYQVIVLEELESRRIPCKSLHDPDAKTEEEKVMRAMHGVFHEYERVKIAERFRMAKLFRARHGVLINGQLPYGYTRVNRSDSNPATALINEDEAEVVRKIRNWFGIDRLTVYAIITRLHRENVPPPRRRASSWRKSTIERMLRCDTYHTGLVYFNKTEAIEPMKPLKPERYRKVKRTSRKPRPREDWIALKVPPIVPNDGLFERIQELLSNRGKKNARNRNYEYLLAGKVFCACGNRRVGDGHGRHHYYRCAERIYKFPIKGACKLSGVNAPILDEMVWGGAVELLSQPDLLAKHATRWLRQGDAQNMDQDAERATLAEQIERLRAEEERYVRAYGAGSLDFDQFRKLMNEAKRRKAKANADMEKLSSVGIAQVPMPSADELSSQLKEVLSVLPAADKAGLLEDLVSKVVIGADRTAEVWAHIPVRALNVGEKHAYGQMHEEIPHLEFRFELLVPEPCKSRRIVERDELGRIRHSKVPKVDFTPGDLLAPRTAA